MSKIAFMLYYGGFMGLMAAFTVKEIWLDRISLILLLLGCWLHARFWKRHIESIIEPVPSLVAALDLLNKERKEMNLFVRLMPNLFSGRTFAEKNEYRFIRLADKSLAQAIRAHFGNNWEFVVISLVPAIPLWLFGIGEFHYERYYRVSPLLHGFIIHSIVALFTLTLSVSLTFFFIFHSLRK